MMKVYLPAAVALLTISALAGCTSAPDTHASPATALASSSSASSVDPTPTPTPTQMSVEKAAATYLSGVCQSNHLISVLNNALVKQDLSAIKKAARRSLVVDKASAQLFDDQTTLWPDSVAKDIPKIADSFFASLAYDGVVANAKTLDAANGATAENVSGASQAAQRIRLRLGLSADTDKGC